MRLGDLASLLGGDLVGGDPSVEVTGAAGVEDARGGDVTFALDGKRRTLALAGEAACVIVGEAAEGAAKPQLKVDNPQYAFARALALLYPPDHGPRGIHAGAHVAPGATLAEGVTVHPFAYVADGARVGARTVLYPGAYVGRGARVGADCVIYPSAVLREGVTLGDRVTVHAGAVIGADGFGFVFVGGEHRKIPQVGAVEIGDDVEIGACSCVDRATTGKTVVGAGTKIDNLVQVAHNVKVGRGVLLVAQAGIAGSTTLGDFAVVGGQVGIADHLSIAPGTRIASQAGVIGDIGPGDFVGSPTMAPRDYFRSWSVFTKLPELKKRVAELEKRLARFETKEEKGDA